MKKFLLKPEITFFTYETGKSKIDFPHNFCYIFDFNCQFELFDDQIT